MTTKLAVLVLDVVFVGEEAVLFGREKAGESVSLFVGDWNPYLCIEAPWGWRSDGGYAEQLRILLDSKVETHLLLKEIKFYKKKLSAGLEEDDGCFFVKSVTEVTSMSILGYAASRKPSTFLKISLYDGRWMRYLKDCFEGFNVTTGSSYVRLIEGGKTQTFNSTIESTLQFMVDVGMMGCMWCEVEGVLSLEQEKRSRCGLEIRGLGVADLHFMEDCDDVGPLRLLSFDIEAAGRRGVFPQASEDPVIQIALQFKIIGEAEPQKPVLLSYKSCDAVEGVDVICFENEADMLKAFSDLVIKFDCDVFTGYNICNFDFLYLRDRAVALQCDEYFEAMTRLTVETSKRSGRMYLRETVYESVQTGKRKRVRVTIPGRVCLDMLTCIQGNQSYKLEKYTLNAVSEHFLNDKKVDLPFTQITPMWEKDSAARRELGIYCLKDAQLPLDLMEKLDSLTQTIEMARCAGIPLDFVLQRGILIRNTSLLLRRAKVRGYVFPSLSQKEGDEDRNRFEGATVLDAMGGIHHNVGVLVVHSPPLFFYISYPNTTLG